MKKLFRNSYFVNFISLLIPLFFVELIFRMVSKLTIFDLSLVRIFIGLCFISGLLSFIFNMFPKILSKIFICIISFISSIYACAQMGFFNFLGIYISLQNTNQLGAVKDYIIDFIKSFNPTYFLTFIPFILLVIYMIFLSNKINYDKVKFKYNFISSIMIILISGLLYYGTLSLNIFETKFSSISNKDLFLTVSNSSMSISKFGTSLFGLLDIRETFFPTKLNNGYVASNNDDVVEVSDNSRIIDDTRWENINNYETNSDYKNLNNYFLNRKITDKNEYTGMFKGKNVIFILMESVNDIFIKYPEYFPNFNYLATNGWNFSNNYSPRNGCATLNNEFSGMTSLYSINSICTAKIYSNNSYYEDVFNLFNREGYITFSAHDYTEHYYPRSIIHKNMGSMDYYGVERLGISYSDEYKDWANDDEFMSEVLKIIDNKTSEGDKFMTWLTTVSSHQPYGYDSIQGNKYLSMTDGTNLPMDVRRYMSKLKILDDGLGILIDGLKSRGLLDDTVIVMYGDHYPYGISLENLNKALDYDTSVDMNAEKVPFVIYNSNMSAKNIKSYTTYVNDLPTIANLFDLNYDPRLYLGNDLFSDDYESLVVFADGSWKNEHAYYNSSTNNVTYYDSNYNDDDIVRINKDVSTKLNISEQVVKINYFKYLEDNLLNNSNNLICLNDDKDKYLDNSNEVVLAENNKKDEDLE